MAELNLTNEQIKAAWDDGHAWVESLNTGDVFLGTKAIADLRYAPGSIEHRLFTTAALHELDWWDVHINEENQIITYKIRRMSARVSAWRYPMED
jgi:hypothetical protein